MNKLFYFIVPFLILVASWFIFDLSRYLPPYLIFHKGIKSESKVIQDKLAQELQTNDIPHRIRHDGFIEYRKKDDKKVMEIFNKINRESSESSILSPEVQKILDKCGNLIEENRLDEALELLNASISKYNNESSLYNFRAIVWRFKREDEKALMDYASAIDSATDLDDRRTAYSNRAILWTSKGEFQKAIEDYNHVLNIYSKDSSALFYSGSAYSKLGDYDKAFSNYKKAIEVTPKWAKEKGHFPPETPEDPIYFSALAAHYAELGSFERAIIAQEEAINLLQKETRSKDILKYQERLKCYRNNELCKE